jgi:predicted ATP-dependent protease
MALTRIPPAELRWRVDAAQVVSASAPESPLEETLDLLTATLKRSLASDTPRRAHVFVRGAEGGMRAELLDTALGLVDPPRRPGQDLCFVHNFDYPDRPRLIRMPAGSGRKLRAGLREISCFIRDRLEEALQARPIRNRLDALQDRSHSEMKRLTAPLEQKLKPHGLVLVREEVGQIVRLNVHVQQTGRVITQDDLANLVAKGQVSAEEFEDIRKVVRDIQPELRRITQDINKTAAHAHHLRGRLLRAETRRLVASLAQPLLKRFNLPEIKAHLDAIVADVIEKRVDRPTHYLADPELLYGANLLPAADAGRVPLVREQLPSTRNLGGTIDPSWLDNTRSVASFQGIRGGSLMAAGNGFLVLDAAELVGRPESVRMLHSALVNRSLPIEAPTEQVASPAVSLRPDPVPVDAHLIVLGTPAQWRTLTRRHPTFTELFAVPVDVPDTVERNEAGLAWLASRMRAMAEAEQLGISDEAVAALVEHAARRGGPGRFSTRLEDLQALVHAAADRARSGHETDAARISAVDVHDSIDALRPRRPEAPRAATSGAPFPAGQPRPGRLHVAGIERDGDRTYGRLVALRVSTSPANEVRLAFDGPRRPDAAGATIRLQAALADLLRLERPFGLHAVVGAEPVIGTRPVEADPAHLLAALLAAVGRLAGAPLRQDLALAGRLDSDGRIGPVPGLDERIEDTYRSVRGESTSGHAGILVPSAQRNALMLRPWLIQAVRNERFAVLGVGNVTQALEILTGEDPGRWRDDGFPADSLLGRARARLAGGA